MPDEVRKIYGNELYREYPSYTGITGRSHDARKFQRVHSPFWDTKDGTDMAYKVKASTFRLGGLGAVIGTCDCLLYSHPTTSLDGALRVGKWTGYMALAGGMYSSAVGLLANLRNEDGPVNHMLGGAMMGSVAGMAAKSTKVGSGMAVFLALSCGLLKQFVNEGVIFMPINKNSRFTYKEMGFLNHENRTFDTFRKEYPSLRDEVKG
ncbi:unnamed protein product [Owenia fusiformis]|uniref:NADH dehydrogenase [ubiquinone] 1 alpha subcomplex subunit 11 n=1 Tax=Owenia fusiformis TaxID=6347 RepID=A0A8J1UXQ1_OWEFU|nr:unnamed protein product [Owenia fusiformis]